MERVSKRPYKHLEIQNGLQNQFSMLLMLLQGAHMRRVHKELIRIRMRQRAILRL